MDLPPVFAQYLTTTRIPTLEYRLDGSTLSYRWADVVPGFGMPGGGSAGAPGPRRAQCVTLHPATSRQTVPAPVPDAPILVPDENYYVVARRVTELPASPR